MKRKIINVLVILFIMFSGCNKTEAAGSAENDSAAQIDISKTSDPEMPVVSLPVPPEPDTPGGGNINSKEPTAYADKEFLADIIDISILKTYKPDSYHYGTLDNSFRIDYNSGEMRMISPELMYSFAEETGLDIITESRSDFYNSGEKELAGVFVQRILDQFYIRAFYRYLNDNNEEYTAELIKAGIKPTWYVNADNPALSQYVFKYDSNSGLDLITDYFYCGYYLEPLDISGENSDYLPGYYYSYIFGNIFILNNEYFITSELRMAFNDDNAYYTDENSRFWSACASIFPLDKTGNLHHKSPGCTLVPIDDTLKITVPILAIENSLHPETTGTLVEKERPFRYSIDKIVDGNPETCYVENTKNDLFLFKIYFDKKRTISAFSIINGYGGNDSLYIQNNRIRNIRISMENKTREFSLEEKPDSQVVNIDADNMKNLIFEVIDVYKGTKWNDTCLAEINFYSDNNWIF